MTPKKSRLNAFELLPDDARALAQEALDAVTSRRMPQIRAYEFLVQRLEQIGIPNDGVKLPSFSSFNRLVISGCAVWRPTARTAADPTLSQNTLRLVASALRALAEDLDGGSQGNTTLSDEQLAAFKRQFLGLPQ